MEYSTEIEETFLVAVGTTNEQSDKEVKSLKAKKLSW